MTLDLRLIARALGGEVVGQQVLCPGPGHSPKDRSLSITLARAAPNGIVTYSHAGDTWRACRDHVLNHLGILPDRKGGTAPCLAVRSVVTPAQPSDHERTERALAIWNESVNPFGTPVEFYLTRPRDQGGRGIWLPAEAAGEVIRYHPNCPFAGSRTPAMVRLVRDVLTNEPKAIHRTALTSGGLKVAVKGHERLSLGPVAGGAIKLTPDEEVTTCLGVGEGVETTLSLRLAPEFGRSPVWALISANGVEHLPVLSGVDCLWIAVDHDEAGVRAARITADRWRDAGAEVFWVKPRPERADLNDLAQGVFDA